MARARAQTAAVAMLLLVAGCTGVGGGAAFAAATSPDAEHFAGLDREVVAEVMSDPIALERLGQEADADRESMAQGMVRNFAVCRDAFELYARWITTGEPGSLAPLPVPDAPREPSHGSWPGEYARFEAAVTSGDPDRLREQLTANGACGQWIPARPNDASGLTIAEAIEAGL